MKLPHSQVPTPEDPFDASPQAFVERLGGRGAPAYIQVRRDNTTQNDVAAAERIEFNDLLNSQGGLSVDLTTNIGRFSGLKAGRTYLCVAHIYISDTGSSNLNFRWHDVTKGTNFGGIGTAQTTTQTSNDSGQPTAVHVFTADEDTELEVRSTGGSGTSDVQPDFTHAYIIEINGPAISGPMELLDVQEVTGSAAQDIDFTGLNGDDDEIYYFHIEWVNDDAGVVLSVQPNNISTNQDYEEESVNGAVDSYSNGATDLRIIGANDDEGFYTGWLQARTGRVRHMMVSGSTYDADQGVTAMRRAASTWSDTSTNITSLRFHSNVASGWGVGTRISLYRIRTQNFPENSFPPGHLDGLGMDFATVDSITIAEGTTKDSTNRADITLKAQATLDLTNPVGIGGLDQGTESANTWYAVLLADGPGVTPGLLGVDEANYPGSIVLPTGYTHYKRVGWILNNSVSDIEAFYQLRNGRDRIIWWDAAGVGSGTPGEVLVNGAQTTFTDVDCSGAAPPTCKELYIRARITASVAGSRGLIRPNGQTDQTIIAPGDTGFNREYMPLLLACDDSQLVEYRVDSGSDQFDINVLGWVDSL